MSARARRQRDFWRERRATAATPAEVAAAAWDQLRARVAKLQAAEAAAAWRSVAAVLDACIAEVSPRRHSVAAGGREVHSAGGNPAGFPAQVRARAREESSPCTP